MQFNSTFQGLSLHIISEIAVQLQSHTRTTAFVLQHCWTCGCNVPSQGMPANRDRALKSMQLNMQKIEHTIDNSRRQWHRWLNL